MLHAFLELLDPRGERPQCLVEQLAHLSIDVVLDGSGQLGVGDAANHRLSLANRGSPGQAGFARLRLVVLFRRFDDIRWVEALPAFDTLHERRVGEFGRAIVAVGRREAERDQALGSAVPAKDRQGSMVPGCRWRRRCADVHSPRSPRTSDDVESVHFELALRRSVRLNANRPLCEPITFAPHREGSLKWSRAR